MAHFGVRKYADDTGGTTTQLEPRHTRREAWGQSLDSLRPNSVGVRGERHRSTESVAFGFGHLGPWDLEAVECFP